MWAVVGWTATHEDVLDEYPQLWAFAEPQTRIRMSRLRQPADRAAVLTAHTLARVVAARNWSVAAVETSIHRSCGICGAEDHGRPSLHLPGHSSLGLSISHSRGLAVVALTDGVVGVDAEPVREPAEYWLSLGTEAFGQAELDAIAQTSSGVHGATYWVRKEALGKLSGFGIAMGLSKIEVSTVSAGGGEAAGPAPGWVQDMPVAAGYVAALATPVHCRASCSQVTPGELAEMISM